MIVVGRSSEESVFMTEDSYRLLMILKTLQGMVGCGGCGLVGSGGMAHDIEVAEIAKDNEKSEEGDVSRSQEKNVRTKIK